MSVKKELIRMKIADLIPYENNPRINSEAVEAVKESIRQCESLDPIEIDEDNIILAGHTRRMAYIELGVEEEDVIRYTGLTDDQKKKYRLLSNKTGEFASWDIGKLGIELEGLDFGGFDFGFKDGQKQKSFFDDKEGWDSEREQSDEYDEFLEKFKDKHTTDDCYTPDNIYEAVADWVSNEYGVDKKNFIRPFFPGGDYQGYKYKKADVVVDNPPFSIMSEILTFYHENNIKYFLFAPGTTVFSSSSSSSSCVCTGVNIVYENGADVNTSFVTNLEDGGGASKDSPRPACHH